MARAPTELARDTRAQILDVAERLVQTRGYNGFSYADVAAEVGVTKATLHYHFAGKAELGAALIERYAGRFFEALARIDREGGDARRRLRAFAAIYADVLRERRMCLCGMLAADYETLPDQLREGVVRFFDETQAWLTEVVDEGAERGDLRLPGSADEAAQAILGGLEGAMLVARPYGDVKRFDATATHLLESLTGGAAREHA
jgi:TetR/AcrR family transcriptional regulator, transcriptional repressor for nem operon